MSPSLSLSPLQAKECLKQAIQFNRHDLSFIMLGKIYLMEGDMAMALDVYKRAVEYVFHIIIIIIIIRMVVNVHLHSQSLSAPIFHSFAAQ